MDTSNDSTTTSATDIITHQNELLARLCGLDCTGCAAHSTSPGSLGATLPNLPLELAWPAADDASPHQAARACVAQVRRVRAHVRM